MKHLKLVSAEVPKAAMMTGGVLQWVKDMFRKGPRSITV